MITIDCKYLAIEGKAPTEAEVDNMLERIDKYAQHHKLKNESNFRQYWCWQHWCDDMVLVLMKDYDNE